MSALEIINSMPIQNLYIALKPKYLEMYRELTMGLPDIYAHEIKCDLATMKSMLKSYGAVDQYRDIFEKCVSPNSDGIAKILWQKQPLSITVVDYYKAMVYMTQESQRHVDPSRALQIAQEWLPVYDYFERQFEVMKNISGRERDVEFLYTLRFCYEEGFDRTLVSVERLQKGIFGSIPPPEPTRKIGTWIYFSGQNIGMHDSANNALNAKMLGEKLPPVSYRISADYGQVSIARSRSSQSDDLFGLAMNISAKINSMARPNGLLIGQGLFEIVNSLDGYVFLQSERGLGGTKGS